MAGPLGKPLLPGSAEGRASAGERRITTLERRGNGRWVYVAGVALAGDQTGIDAPSWIDPDLGQIFGWQAPWAEAGGADAQSDGLTRYRIGRSGLEMVINGTGGATQTLMFTLIQDFWSPLDGKQTFTATDDAGNFTCYTIVPRTDKNTCADVYSGRV